VSESRFVCVHGHFYQPPRDNPWTGSVEPEPSAWPLHDWNERVTEECYKPFTAARIHGEGHRIQELSNLFSRLSFNVGPTLMAWLEHRAPTIYERILTADGESRQRFGGQGSAIAQAYNHMILPLANERDRRTQVRWGRRDFEHRFGRSPEGMWLPETAVDTDSLEAMAAEGIRFTILAPYQAAEIRPPGGEHLATPGDGGADPGIPYVQHLPSGRSIIVFYYDGPLSQAVAFDRLLDDGPEFARRLNDVACSGHGESRLTNIATDGESYGHHHRHGEMALAWALRQLEQSDGTRPTVYGAYLDRRPPMGETRIADDTAWSCAHGVERWRSACGCSIGAGDPAGQSWRAPLRKGLDALRDSLASVFEREGAELLRDPWEARDSWIDCVLDPAPERVTGWLADRGVGDLDGDRGRRARTLLEMQRHAMLMFTSCGWFFDDIDGIESRQILRYAGRALDLTRLAGCEEQADRAEREFVRTLATAAGGGASGDAIYVEERDGCRTDLRSAVAHVALGAAADGGRGRPLVPGAAFKATIESLTADRLGAEAVEGTIDIELCPDLDQARFEFAGARAADGRVLAGVQPDPGSDGLPPPGSTVESILEAFEEQVESAGALLAGRFGTVIEPGPWMRPDALREVPVRSVNAGTSSRARELSVAGPDGEFRQWRTSSWLPGSDPPMSNPALDGPLSWRLVRWTGALRSLAALLIENDPDPTAIRDGAAEVRAWTLGPSAPDLAAGHPSRKSARLQPVLGGDILAWRLVERLERDVKSLGSGSGSERRLLDRMLAALNAAGMLGLHPDTWETQTLWWSYSQSVDDTDGLTARRDRVGRKLGFE
jgi:alpha-amylase/alpha-mannosidase (GH57 family)